MVIKVRLKHDPINGFFPTQHRTTAKMLANLQNEMKSGENAKALFN